MSQVLLQTSLESATMFLHENSANSLAWEPTLSTFGRTTSPWASEGTCCSYFSRISPSAEPPMRPVWEILKAGAPRHSLGPELGAGRRGEADPRLQVSVTSHASQAGGTLFALNQSRRSSWPGVPEHSTCPYRLPPRCAGGNQGCEQSHPHAPLWLPAWLSKGT